MPSPPPARPAIPPPRRRQDTGSSEVLREPDPYEVARAAADGERIARATRAQVDSLAREHDAIADMLGTPPDALKPEGTGALGLLFTKLDKVGTAVDGLAVEFKRDREAAELREKERAEADTKAAAAAKERVAPVRDIGLSIVKAVAIAAVLGAVAWIGSRVDVSIRSPATAPAKLP